MSEASLARPVYGIETEYSIMLTFDGQKTYELVGDCHSPDKAIGLFVAPSKKGSDYIPSAQITAVLEETGIYRNGLGMLSNGGRLYIDPSGPEYDTPETTTAEEAVLRTFDGDAILYSLYGKLQQRGVIESFQLNRRVVDHNRSSRGIHLNHGTLLPTTVPDDTTAVLAALNVAKGALFGSGGLLLNEEGQTEFHHSPRLSITSDFSSHYSSYKLRPLVRIPFKSDTAGRRVESVTCDALNFAWPLRASLVMTNAVLRLIEMQRTDGLPILYKPLSAAKVVGQYGNEHNVSVERDEGILAVRPLDILRTICEVALETDEREGHLDPESQQVVREVVDIADKASFDPSSVATHVESVARLHTMEKRMAEKKVGLSSEVMCRLDYAWDRIGGGIAERLRQKPSGGWAGFSAEHDKNARRRRLTPPTDTRAKIRGEYIKKNKGKADSDWDHVGKIHIGPHQHKL